MNEALLLTDRSYYCNTFTTTIWFSKSHITLDPYSFTYKLLVELTFINVDNLLTSPHKFSYLHHCLLLLLSYLILVDHLAAIGIHWLDICDLLLLVCIS